MTDYDIDKPVAYMWPKAK